MSEKIKGGLDLKTALIISGIIFDVLLKYIFIYLHKLLYYITCTYINYCNNIVLYNFQSSNSCTQVFLEHILLIYLCEQVHLALSAFIKNKLLI